MSDGTTLCQTCKDVAVSEFLPLGMQPACLFPENETQAENEPAWPLDLGFCPRCSLVQIMEPVSERILFSGDYHHLAGLTGGYRLHLRALADELAQLHAPHPGSEPRRHFAVEIGSNDGSLLDELAERDFTVLGIDPNGADSPGGSPVVREYFSSEVASQVLSDTRPADLVLALNTFAHVTNMHDFLDGVRSLMSDHGMFVSESHYLPDLLETLQYDFAYHEHSRYYSLTALQAAFEPHGLEVFRIDRIATHGGSVRVYAGFKGAHEVHESVAALRDDEDRLELTGGAVYQKFAARVQEHRERLRGLLDELTGDGSRVAAASSPARAVTLLNYCSLGPAEIDFISEISPRKIGRLSPGTHIPIVHQDRLCGPEQPEYALLLSWHIAEELISRLREEGFTGKFVVPLPEPRVIS
ncbi:class I SAM-dependent methyltransferase [Streptomyces sp. NBC_01754]|uniref:class I SAM-dependent methyltransferase n=1 Tax=Streptomyces sp. NBC_01754 TaxID=2975930 RepID=UPI002DD938A2|nr:class I SAM-dependent methyltransferase [Streptomyces sp. NBC_01754]WSC90926.1 class I SAM-dependent methyltransferase [Streptomyces sp. NBC_01754]WSC96580.1 class I SAM-dependent methyltransferase [Streptomyces sp. NBC_01754]